MQTWLLWKFEVISSNGFEIIPILVLHEFQSIFPQSQNLLPIKWLQIKFCSCYTFIVLNEENDKTHSFKIEYELVAQICHSGSSNSGHYWADISTSGGWLKCNNRSVTKLDQNLLDSMFLYIISLSRFCFQPGWSCAQSRGTFIL